MRQHRDHGLGVAMKVANRWAVMERHLEVRSISTRNAAENAPMIAVNDEMGLPIVVHAASGQRNIARSGRLSAGLPPAVLA